MDILVKTVQVNVKLTPADVVKALLSFTQEDWHELQLEIQRLLIEEDVDVGDWFNFPFPDSEPASDSLAPSELALPTEPPPTPEGDVLALAAAEELFTLFDDLDIDPELARWGATSEEISLENSYLWSDNLE